MGTPAFQAGAEAPAWLSDDEAGRLQAMSLPARRHSFLAGHWLARELAADWLQVEMARLSLDRHPDQRPRLLLDGEALPLSLGLSHSGDWLAVALAEVLVGIDVELPRRQRDLDALARFAFSPDEAGRLRDAAQDERIGLFHTLWTLKEARGKRSGEGLLPARARRISAQPCQGDEAEATSWTLGQGALAVAVEPGVELQLEGGDLLADRRHWRYVELD